jgi:hypothetical protein
MCAQERSDMRWTVLISSAAIAVGCGFGFVSTTRAGDFASSVTDYAEGTFLTVAGEHYTQTSAAIGKPSPIVGAGTAFAGILSPFNSHYEQDQLVGFGLGGHITLQFPQAVAVTGSPQIGIFTSAAFVDQDYPNGNTGANAHTGATDEYGAERTAIIEVAKSPNDFRSLGRIVLYDTTNYFATATGPFQYPPPDPAQLASFDQPFSGSPSDFNNKNFAGVLSQLNGSAGGTWLSIPGALGLDAIQYVRISDPKWKLPDGTLVDTRASVYFPPPDEFIKPADVFLDGAVLIPEPTSIAVIGVALMLLRRTR